MMAEAFGLHSLPGSAMAIGIGAGLLLAGFGAMLLWMAIGLRRVAYQVDGDSLRIRAPFYGRRVPRSALKMADAKLLANAEEFTAKRFGRRNGVGLPGYRVGWFKNREGEKALLFVGDRDKVLSIPTTEGYSLYLSTDNPAELLSALGGK